MNITFTFKDFEPSDHLRKYAERRFKKLERFVGKAEDVELTVILSVDKIRHKVDVHLKSDQFNLSAMETSQDMYASVDQVLDKLEARLKKFNEKRIGKHRRGSRDQDGTFSKERYFIKQENKRKMLFQENKDELLPLTPDQAADKLEDEQLDHIVFLHVETNTLHLLYRKFDGTFFLIETVE